jgi:hypothetical protein
MGAGMPGMNHDLDIPTMEEVNFIVFSRDGHGIAVLSKEQKKLLRAGPRVQWFGSVGIAR